MRWLLGGLLAIVAVIAIVLVGGYFALKRDDIPYATLEQSYANQASQFVELEDGVRVHFRDEGQAAGAPTLLLIHGFSASLHTWEPWVERLRDEYRVISLDLPGHGLTQAPENYQASIDAYVRVVEQFVASQRLSRFAIAGNSMGGNVSWEYALTHPDQVQALILVSSSGWEDTRDEVRDEPPIFQLLRNPTIGPLLRDLDNTALIRQGVEAAYADPAFVDDAVVARYGDMARAPGHRDILLQMTLGFRERNYATPERLAPLANIPVLIIQGDGDRIVPPEHARQFNAAISGSQLMWMEGVGHVPQETHADETAAALREFLHAAFEPAALAHAN